MVSDESADLAFKFQFIVNRQPRGRKWRGGSDATGLNLGDAWIAYEDIRSTIRVRRRLLLYFRQLTNPGSLIQSDLTGQLALFGHVAIGVYGNRAAKLKLKIDRASSAAHAEWKRAQLLAAGRADQFRAVTCPDCQSTVDLSGMPSAPYTYCPCCQTVFAADSILTRGEEYRICTTCGFFGRVRDFTEWYFMFVVIIIAYQSQKKQLCGRCRSSLKWGMFFGNLLIGFLGIFPYIVWRLCTMERPNASNRALRRSRQLARKGKVQRLSEVYRPVYEFWPDHPGLLFNEAIACVNAGDQPGAIERTRRLSKACPNFLLHAEQFLNIHRISPSLLRGT